MPQYNGSALASMQNVIVVTLNYRLGALGFLGMYALQQENSSFETTGNYGFLDQRAAMHWVQDNIAAFGGDPDRVTIFGESAGGLSVCWHMVSPGSGGLFHAAIIESATCARAYTMTEANAIGVQLAQAVGCNADADMVCVLV